MSVKTIRVSNRRQSEKMFDDDYDMYPRFRCAGYEEEYLRTQKLAKEKAAEELRRKEEEMNAPIDPKAISAISNILSRVSGRNGDLNGQLDWVKKEVPFDPVVFESHPNTHGHPDVKRAREALQELELSIGLTKQLQAYLDAQRQTVREKVDALALRVGFASLPMSILSEVIEFATSPRDRYSGSESENRMKAHNVAIKLSHVCRQFRAIVLTELRSSFWSTISEHMVDAEKIKFCVARSRKSPIDVFIESWGLRQPNKDIEQFFKAILLSSKKWGTLTVGKFKRGTNKDFDSDDVPKPGECEEKICESINTIRRLSEGAKLPKLKKLSVHFNKVLSPHFLDPKYNPFWCWTMPNLVELSISGCHPPRAGSFHAPLLKEFYIKSDATSSKPFKMIQLALFLAFCRSLEKVSLCFMNWDTTIPCELRGIASVREVDLRFITCKPEASKGVCSSIHFPKASKMSFTIAELNVKEFDSLPEDQLDAHVEAVQEEWESRYQAIVTECFEHHPSLKSLSYSFFPETYMFTSILLPLTSLPILEELSLELQCWNELKFWGDSDDPKVPSSVPENLHLPSIRRLNLYSSNISMQWSTIFRWPEKLFAQLKKQGQLNAFEKLDLCETAPWTRAGPNVSKLEGSLHDYLPPEKISSRWIYSN
ncbi:hypothetical protein SCHPADRAFT_928755 [Schizopora paradoxa]|uniref:Uncharacterized protein n=1 Tax=Schizopora paradoxa TaxID=27342 RepID=A0A0H2RNI3_9AGAM|nr:hypothetical protein SCHPADRAFT_928755 [Schizopora paradoxa]